MGLINSLGAYSGVNIHDGAAYSRHSEVADGDSHGKAPVVLPRIENIMNLHDSLISARSSVEERGSSVEVPESDLQEILEKIRALEDEVSALLSDDDGGQSIEVTTSEEAGEGGEISNANEDPVSGAPAPPSANSNSAGFSGSNVLSDKSTNKPVAAAKAADVDSQNDFENNSNSSENDLKNKPGKDAKSFSEKSVSDKPKSKSEKVEEEDQSDQKISVNDKSTEASDDDSSDPLPGGGLFKEKVMVETETMTSTMEDIDSTTTMTSTSTTTITVYPTNEPTPTAEADEMKAGAIQGAKFMELSESPTTSDIAKVTTPIPQVANIKAKVLSTPSERSEKSAITPAVFGAKFKEIEESQSVSGKDALASSPGTTTSGSPAVASASSPGITIHGSDVSASSPGITVSGGDALASAAGTTVDLEEEEQQTVAANKVIDTPTPAIQAAPNTMPHKQFFKATSNKDDDKDINVNPTQTPSGFQTVTVPKKPKEAVSDA